jgi:hypothetical protein
MPGHGLAALGTSPAHKCPNWQKIATYLQHQCHGRNTVLQQHTGLIHRESTSHLLPGSLVTPQSFVQLLVNGWHEFFLNITATDVTLND